MDLLLKELALKKQEMETARAAALENPLPPVEPRTTPERGRSETQERSNSRARGSADVRAGGPTDNWLQRGQHHRLEQVVPTAAAAWLSVGCTGWLG